MRHLTFAICFVGGLLFATPAAAQDPTAGTTAPTGADASRDEEARGLFAAGRSAYEAGRYEDALSHFRRAHELSQRPELLFNIAQSADRLRLDADALAAYRGFVEARPDHPQAGLARERVRFLERASAPATATTTPGEAPVVPTVAPVVGEPSDETPIVEQWWLWTIVGVVVVGAGVGIGVGVALGGGDTLAMAPPGSTGGVIMTLEVRP